MKNPLRLQALPFALGALLLSSCTHRIKYSLGDEYLWENSHIEGSLRVDEFKDEAPQDERINVRVGKDTWRVNGREGYRNGEIAPGVSRQIARHLHYSGLFDEVHGPESEAEADYVLTGTIYDYNATGLANEKAEITILLGTSLGSLPGTAIAAAATRKVQTQISANVELRDVRLRDAETGRTLWRRSRLRGRQELSEEHFLQADSKALYRRADRQLREIVDQIVDELGNSRLAE